ncbi:MAG: DMT family transporter [Clostridia bacterium]|nr:DMT family transporter [Clostridia bacterium]
MKRQRIKAILYAFMAAVFYAGGVPLSKLLLSHIEPTMMAGLLYFGAGAGIGLMSLFRAKDTHQAERLSKEDLPYVMGMIVLDIAAPIFLMFGITDSTSSSASLLGNFEIVATTIIALVIFKEAVSKQLWAAIFCITIASVMLSLDGADTIRFSTGSLLVLAATLCWGLENNCTRQISSKSTYEIVMLKGFFSGGGSLVIAFLLGERMAGVRWILAAMLLGFVAYGLSIFFYVRAQNTLGAAKTSAYYATAPFAGAGLSFLILGEILTPSYFAAFLVMLVGTVLVVRDTLVRVHHHEHEHLVTHTHDGTTHTHVIRHSHEHEHILSDARHTHHHSREELLSELKGVHQT